jgi:hypothetical protein
MLDTTVSIKYMLAGYTIIISVLVIYVTSLAIRWRNLKRDHQVLNEIEKKG